MITYLLLVRGPEGSKEEKEELYRLEEDGLYRNQGPHHRWPESVVSADHERMEMFNFVLFLCFDVVCILHVPGVHEYSCTQYSCTLLTALTLSFMHHRYTVLRLCNLTVAYRYIYNVHAPTSCTVIIIADLVTS